MHRSSEASMSRLCCAAPTPGKRLASFTTIPPGGDAIRFHIDHANGRLEAARAFVIVDLARARIGRARRCAGRLRALGRAPAPPTLVAGLVLGLAQLRD